MTHFMGTHQNRLDAKGRVSVPAPFRAVLRQIADPDCDTGSALVLRPSHNHPCVEAWPVKWFQALSAPLERLDLFSEEHEDLASSLYAEAFPTDIDKEGRIALPAALIDHAGLQEGVAFMGLGRIFQIWEPAAADRRRAEAFAKSRRLTLPGVGAA